MQAFPLFLISSKRKREFQTVGMCVSIPLSPGDSCRSTKRTCCRARAIGRFFVPGADGASGFPLLLLHPQPPSALSPLAGQSHMSPATLTRPTHTSLSARHQLHLSHLFMCVCVCVFSQFFRIISYFRIAFLILCAGAYLALDRIGNSDLKAHY